MDSKTHYRKVFKSDHLSIADLEDFVESGNNQLIFTIDKVVQYYIDSNVKNSGVKVAGKTISANIAYFKDKIKPLVLNATNSKTVKSFNGGSPFVEDWKDTIVQLYIDDKVRMKGEIVGGVRINKTQPKATVIKLTPDSDNWGGAVDFLKVEGHTIEQITKKYSMTKDDIEQLVNEASK